MSSPEQTPEQQTPEQQTPEQNPQEQPNKDGIFGSLSNFFTGQKDDKKQKNVPPQGGRKTKRVNYKKRVIKRKKNKTKKSRRTKN